MNRLFRRAVMGALLVSAASVAVVTAIDPAPAAQRRAPANTTRNAVGVPINDALKAFNMMDYDAAMAKVEQADKVKDKTPFEEYTVAKFLGAIALARMPTDFATATTAYNRMIDSGAAPDEEKANMYDLGMKLNFQAGDKVKAIADAVELKKIRPLDDTGYQVLTQAYYQQDDMPNTITTAKEAIAALVAGGSKPDAAILGMLLNAQARTNDPGYRQTLDQLATVSKQPEVWGQVMDFALSSQGITDHQLLNVFRLAMRVGTMRDVDYTAMATIDLMNGLSIEGKKVLEKGIADGKIMRMGAVANLLIQANGLVGGEQKSLPDLAAEAAKQPNGEIYVKLGESYWAYGQNDMALQALQMGIDKGGLKDAADAQTTLGIVLLDLGRSADALAAFKKAESGGGTAGGVAHTWSLFTERETA